MLYTYQILIEILEENFGIFIIEDKEKDFSINDYITDSLLFIQFVLAIEEKIGAELSDDFLDFEILNSAKGFSEKLNFFIQSLQQKPTTKLKDG